MMGVGWIIGLFILIGLAWMFSGFYRKNQSPLHNGSLSDPETILKQRLASGEIDEEEYHRLKEEIRD